MTDVRQWLGEIKNLQQKLEQARKERDEAFASASNWRSLYEAEAQQRRTEANLHRQALESMNSDGFRGSDFPAERDAPENPARQSTLQDWAARFQTVDELRNEVMRLLVACDRLEQQLRAEREHHTRTRQELTTALGDAMDLLGKTKGESTPK